MKKYQNPKLMQHIAFIGTTISLKQLKEFNK